MLDQEMFDEAALILLTLGAPDIRPSFMAFHNQFKGMVGPIGLVESKRLYSAFMGFDGREWPTHNVLTGRRI